jgi:type-F conjugative transfer system pilin assembly protein TrbC
MRMLLIIFCCFAINHVLANPLVSNEEFAKNLGANAKELVWQQLQELVAELEARENNISLQKEKEQVARRLYVFISISMPLPLLKDYYRQSKKYGAVLMLKGLPNGSFKQLYRLVQEIAGGGVEDEVAMQIDDEAFARYKIERVPSFVLIKEQKYHPSKEQAVAYDKLTGNVGIKYALKQFASHGELRNIAKEYLYDN